MRRLAVAVAVCVVVSGCTTTVVVGPRATPGGSAAGAGGPASVGIGAGHVGVLSAALRAMTADYGREAAQAPGPADVLDYDVGDLWLRGIDGTGTTIALMEG